MTSSEPTGSAPGTSGVAGANAPGPQTPSAPAPTAPTGGAIGTPPPAPSTARRRARTTGWSLFLGLLIFVTVVLVLFVVFNTQTVDISLVFGDVRAPLVLALVIAAALGGLVVGLAGLVMAARGRSRRNATSD